MATSKDHIRLWRDIGASEADLSPFEIDFIYEEAAESYSSTATIHAAVRVIALQGMLASAANLVDFDQNESSEKLSQVSKNLRELLDIWEARLAAAVAADEATSNAGVTPQPTSAARLRAVY